MLNRLMDKTPFNDRPAYMAWNHLALNIGILAGSFLGPVLGDSIGVKQAVLVSGIMRLVAGFLVGLWA